MVDITELVKHEEVMKVCKLGPNGALVYCMEFLEKNVDWLLKKILNLKEYYLLIDCPGQVNITFFFFFMIFITNLKIIRLNYIHIMSQLIKLLKNWEKIW